jgi:hypothetical protein
MSKLSEIKNNSQAKVLILLLVFIFAVAGMFVFFSRQKPDPSKNNEQNPTPTVAAPKTYSNIRDVQFRGLINGFKENNVDFEFVLPSYADLTNDGNEEAIVGYKVAEDEPEKNYLYLYVYTLSDGKPLPMTSLKSLYKAEYEVTPDKLLRVKEYRKTGGVPTLHTQTWNFVTGAFTDDK